MYVITPSLLRVLEFNCQQEASKYEHCERYRLPWPPEGAVVDPLRCAKEILKAFYPLGESIYFVFSEKDHPGLWCFNMNCCETIDFTFKGEKISIRLNKIIADTVKEAMNYTYTYSRRKRNHDPLKVTKPRIHCKPYNINNSFFKKLITYFHQMGKTIDLRKKVMAAFDRYSDELNLNISTNKYSGGEYKPCCTFLKFECNGKVHSIKFHREVADVLQHLLEDNKDELTVSSIK